MASTSWKHRQMKAALDRESLRQECVQLALCDNLSLRQIAARLGCHHNTVKRRLDEARALWAEEAAQTVEEHRQEATAQNKILLHELWECFRRSLIDQTRSKVTKRNGSGDSDDGTVSTELEKRQSVGDPAAWAARIESVIEKIVKLNGGYPPQQIDVNLGIGGMFDALKAAEEATMPTIVDAEFVKLEGPDGGNGNGQEGGGSV